MVYRIIPQNSVLLGDRARLAAFSAGSRKSRELVCVLPYAQKQALGNALRPARYRYRRVRGTIWLCASPLTKPPGRAQWPSKTNFVELYGICACFNTETDVMLLK
jgi:hypothetical protein